MLENLVNSTTQIIQRFGFWGVFGAGIIEQIIIPIPSPIVPMGGGFFLVRKEAFSWLVYVLGKGTTNGSGDITLSGSEDLNKNILNMKVWLVTISDLASGSLGDNQMNGWHGDDYLFELGMMDYYDADL